MGLDQTEEEEEDGCGWLKNPKEHVNLAGGYENVRIFLTDKGFGTVHKWCATDMKGVLKLIQKKEVHGFPVVLIELIGTDEAGVERATVFSYELPFNFTLESDLSRQLCAIGLSNGEYVGFYFAEPVDKVDFASKLSGVHARLSVSPAQLEAFRRLAQQEKQNELQEQLNETIDCFNLLSGQDEDRRAQDLRKILILAGLRVDTELCDPETVALI